MGRLLAKWLGGFIQAGLLSFSAPVFADQAQDYYAANVEELVQGKCIVCHRTGGQAASKLFTDAPPIPLLPISPPIRRKKAAAAAKEVEENQ